MQFRIPRNSRMVVRCHSDKVLRKSPEWNLPESGGTPPAGTEAVADVRRSAGLGAERDFPRDAPGWSQEISGMTWDFPEAHAAGSACFSRRDC